MAVFPSGWSLTARHTVDSTNAALKRMVADGAGVHEGLVLTAASQTAGRGRQGRTWVSPTGNLYASFLIAAPVRVAAAPEIGFIAAVAVIDAFPTKGLRCKWPNDVLLGGAKLCGILPELATDPDGKTWIILGIGVNLRPVGVNADYPVTSLADHGLMTTPAEAVTAIASSLARRLSQWRSDGFAPIADAWATVGPAQGDRLTVRLPGATAAVIDGRFLGLDQEGALMLETETGTRRILAGDVLFQTLPQNSAALQAGAG